MITSLNGKVLTIENGEEREDLTRIKGIGLVKQQWLRELLHIQTFRDLSSFSVDEIESKLRTQGHMTSKSEIEQWIVQAEKLAAAEQSLQEFVESSDSEVEEPSCLPIQESESSHQVMASVDAETEENFLSSTGSGEWQSFASFRIEFQSRQIKGQVEEQRILVHYLEGNQFQTWSDLESDRLQQWMLDRIGEGMLQPYEGERPDLALPVALEITQIQAFQPAQTARPMVVERGNRLFPNAFRSKQPWALEVAFRLTGLTAAHLTEKQVSYYAQFFARDRATDVVIHLGDTEPAPLIEGQLTYTAMLPEIMLEPGIYRLQAIVKLQGVPATLGSFKVPLLQVV
jgi:hypothetical protein